MLLTRGLLKAAWLLSCVFAIPACSYLAMGIFFSNGDEIPSTRAFGVGMAVTIAIMVILTWAMHYDLHLAGPKKIAGKAIYYGFGLLSTIVIVQIFTDGEALILLYEFCRDHLWWTAVAAILWLALDFAYWTLIKHDRRTCQKTVQEVAKLLASEHDWQWPDTFETIRGWAICTPDDNLWFETVGNDPTRWRPGIGQGGPQYTLISEFDAGISSSRTDYIAQCLATAYTQRNA